MTDNSSTPPEEAEPPSTFDTISDVRDEARTTLALARMVHRLTMQSSTMTKDEVADLHLVIGIVMERSYLIVDACEGASAASGGRV